MTFSTIGLDTQTGQLVQIHKFARKLGLYIIGAPGMGKSGLMENLCTDDDKQGTGFCVQEPHGELIKAVIARLSSNRERDVTLLDITDEDHPFGLNLFACANPNSAVSVQYVVDQVMHIFDKLYDVSRSTPRMAQYLRNCTYTLVANPGYTMAEIPLLLTNEHFRRSLTANVTDPKVQLFWKTYESMKPFEQREHAESTLNKLDEFLSPLVLNIVGQSKSTIDFRAIMDERKILLVKLDAQMDQVTSLIGAVIIAMLLNAAYSRADLPVEKRKQFNTYFDEFPRFATEDFAILLTEARKFAIGTTIAHQARYQPGMTDGIRATSLSASNLVIFKVSGVDADELAGEFDSTPPPPPITGYTPILSPKRDVLEHLLSRGHTNETVTRFTKEYVIHAFDVLKNQQSDKYYSYFWVQPEKGFWESIRAGSLSSVDSSAIRTDDLRKVLHTLNDLLYQCQVTKNADVALPPFLLAVFAMLYRFERGIPEYSYRRVEKGHIPTIFQPSKELLLLCQPSVFQNADMLKSSVEKPKKFHEAMRFITALRETMTVLASDPILVDTGQHEPIYDKPRTYQDVQNECATRLANLPKYHAKVKIADTEQPEHIVKTLEPEKGLYGKALQERIERIQARNRTDGYTRKREIVQAEIIKRQSQWSGHQQSPPHQPRVRGSLICKKCEAQNQSDAKFCSQCGEKL